MNPCAENILDPFVKSYKNKQFAFLLLWTGDGDQDLLGLVLNFFHSMALLRVTETEYTLLTATALLCSGHKRSNQLYKMANNHWSQERLCWRQTLWDFLTPTIYSCVLFSFRYLHPTDRAPLQAAPCVEKMQEVILDLLSRVCRTHAGAARGGPQRFGRLLGRLTELRTLHHNYLLLTRQQPGLWWRQRSRNHHNRLWEVAQWN